MPQGNPKPGEKYLHFKKKAYQIIAVATHSETSEKMVVYQALYGDFGVYVRPYDMFISEVDRDKYPQAEQRYRFRYLEEGEVLPDEIRETDPFPQEEVSEENVKEAVRGEELREEEPEQGESLLIHFLDAETFAEKYEIVDRMKGELTDKLIDDLAVAIDVVIPEGPMADRYKQLKNCIQTRIKYEGR